MVLNTAQDVAIYLLDRLTRQDFYASLHLPSVNQPSSYGGQHPQTAIVRIIDSFIDVRGNDCVILQCAYGRPFIMPYGLPCEPHGNEQSNLWSVRIKINDLWRLV